MSFFSGNSSRGRSGSGFFSGSSPSTGRSHPQTTRYGDKDYGLAGKHPVKTGPYFTAPLTGRPHTTVKSALKDGFCASDLAIAQTKPCPKCVGDPEKYKFLMGKECEKCNGLGRVPLSEP